MVETLTQAQELVDIARERNLFFMPFQIDASTVTFNVAISP